MLDTLDLVPAEIDVSKAQAVLSASLREHGY